MPWYNGNYPPSYKNQPLQLREKAVEIANSLLEDGTDEGIAIATGLNHKSSCLTKGRVRLTTPSKMYSCQQQWI